MQSEQGQQGNNQSGRGANSEPIQIAKYLKGAEFPASKDDLVECAEQNDAPEEVIEAIQVLDSDNFESITEVTQADSKSSSSLSTDDEEDM